jgi:hypothetical protein
MVHLRWIGAALVACAAALPASADPILHAEAWKTEVIQYEPILIRITMENPGDEELLVVPPYVSFPCRLNWPLRLSVTRAEDGTTVFDTGAPESALLPRFGDYWWYPRFYDPVRGPWCLAPGGSGCLWFNVRACTGPLPPGPYTVHLTYDAHTEMLRRPEHPEDVVPEGVWEGQLTSEVGPVTVREPAGEDATAAVVFQGTRVGLDTDDWSGSLRTPILENHQSSTYAPYARFYEFWTCCSHALGVGGYQMPFDDARADADQFLADYPDFPLNYQLPIALGWCGTMHRCGARLFAERRWANLLEQVRATGDLSLTQRFETFRDAARQTHDEWWAEHTGLDPAEAERLRQEDAEFAALE